MADGFTIKTTVRSKPVKLIRGMGVSMDRATLQSARLLRREARDRAPVQTGGRTPYTDHDGRHGGALKRSITIEKIRPRQYDVGPRVSYAGFVEYGTFRMAAQPYLRPAITATRAAMKRRYEICATRVLRQDYSK